MPISTRLSAMQERLGTKLSLALDKFQKRKPQHIQLIDDNNFAKRYELADVVMPTGHHDMEIRHATRYSDREEVIVKLRFKPGCFKTKEEERDWRRGMEFMLNLPANMGVTRIYEVFEDSRAFYVVTEKAPGQDLFDLLATEKKFTMNSVQEIMHDLLQALAHLHEHNGIHKDLKLENIVVCKDRNSPRGSGDWSPQSVKLIDFDTVEEFSPRDHSPSRDVMGTNQYIAQEAYKGIYSPLSDIFALGVIGYRLSTGRFPFDARIFDDKPGENWVGSPKMQEIRQRLQHSQVNFDKQVFKEYPLAADLLAKMLQYNEIDRPTAKQALQHEWMQSKPEERPEGWDARHWVSPSDSPLLPDTNCTSSESKSPKVFAKVSSI